MSRINIDVTAEDQSDGELVARLISASLNAHNFDDVTNVSNLTHQDTEDEVVEAMRNLNPAIFASEVVIDVQPFEPDQASSPDDVPGIGEFPEPGEDDEVETSEDER